MQPSQAHVPQTCVSFYSRPLYLPVAVELILAQVFSLEGTWAGATVTLVHTLLIVVLVSVWSTGWLLYIAQILGVVSLLQWGAALDQPIESLPVTLAQLALGYGIIGYGLSIIRNNLANTA